MVRFTAYERSHGRQATGSQSDEGDCGTKDGSSPKSSAHRDRSLIQEKPDIEGSRHGFSPIASIPQSHAHTQLITVPPYENLSASSITSDCTEINYEQSVHHKFSPLVGVARIVTSPLQTCLTFP